MKRIPHKVALLLAIMALFAASVNSLYAAAAEKKILVFGDSLVAGYNLPVEQAFPAQLEKALRAKGFAVKVINAGVSGDTTSGGLARLEWSLQQNPDYVILELGANDMLRAIDPSLTRENLKKMLTILRDRKIPALLVGMKAYINMGPQYMFAFNKIYPDLADEFDVPLYPFFLEGVAFESRLLLDDGMHPNAAGVAETVRRILPSVKKLLTE